MKCIIVDDEPIARLGMKNLIEQFSELELLGSFINTAKAADFMEKNQIDLVFLDIQMPGISGLEFASSIPRNTLIIFTTAYSEYAVEGFETDAIDYLLKPIELDRFRKAVNKALMYHNLLKNEKTEIKNTEKTLFFVKSERRFVKILFDDILYIEGLKDYIVIVTDEKRIITKTTMKAVSEMLPVDNFVRANKSYIVNINKVEAYDNNDIFIQDNEIALSPKYKQNILKFLHKSI